MTVLRIVPNLPSADPQRLAAFYQAVLGLQPVMDHGFIVTLAGDASTTQMSLASEGGSGTPLPALSIEVDDLDSVLERATSHGAAIEYGPMEEPWGVRRVFLRDPAGNLVNVLSHA